MKRLSPIFDIDDIGDIEDGNPPTGNAMAYDWRVERMDHRERFKTQTPDCNRPSDLHDPAVFDFVIVRHRPYRAGGVDGTVGAVAQPPA